MKVICEYCKKECERENGHVNRARKLGLKVFCNRKCAGLGRRVNRTEEQDKEIKRVYDIEYRARNRDYRKERAKAYNESPAGRAMQKRNREKFKQSHLEYFRTEEYKKWKHEYDQTHNAKKMYGEFWESFLIIKEVEKIIEPEKYDTKYNNGLLNKSQKRKRSWNSMQKI